MGIPHEITMIAYQADEEGLLQVVDIIETNLRNAPFFARRWYRQTEVTAIAAAKPGTAWNEFRPRNISRAAA